MMDRTQKKCVIGSAMLHGLLVGILLFGMAFTKKDPAPAYIEIISLPTIFKTTDGATHGGTPLSAPPAPQPVQQPPSQPQPQPQKIVQPTPQPPPQSERKVETPIVHEAPVNARAEIQIHASPKKAKTPRVDLTPIVRNDSKNKTKKSKTDLKNISHEQETDDNNAHSLATERSFSGAIGNIRNNSSRATTVEIGTGGSGGGEASVNYRQLVLSLYDQAWIDPDDVTDEHASVKTEITVSRDGSASGRILKRSGIPSMDRSVQRALDRVRFIKTFPAESKDSERTFVIDFNLKSRRGLG